MINLEFRPSSPWNVIQAEDVSFHFFSDAIPVPTVPRHLSGRDHRIRQQIVFGDNIRGQTNCDQEESGRDPDIQRRDGMMTLRNGKKFPSEEILPRITQDGSAATEVLNRG